MPTFSKKQKAFIKRFLQLENLCYTGNMKENISSVEINEMF